MNNEKIQQVVIWLVVGFFAILLPVGSVIIGHFMFGISLPTLMFISFMVLLCGSITCWPGRDKTISSEGIILLLLGQASAIGVIIVFVIRLLKLGLLFTWM